MSAEELNQLTKEIEQLRVTTRRLETVNTRLINLVQVLESQIATPERKPEEHRFGNIIRILVPTCPGTNRKIIPSNGLGTVTRVSSDWTHYIADSSVRTKRIPRNIELINIS